MLGSLPNGIGNGVRCSGLMPVAADWWAMESVLNIVPPGQSRNRRIPITAPTMAPAWTSMAR